MTKSQVSAIAISLCVHSVALALAVGYRILPQRESGPLAEPEAFIAGSFLVDIAEPPPSAGEVPSPQLEPTEPLEPEPPAPAEITPVIVSASQPPTVFEPAPALSVPAATPGKISSSRTSARHASTASKRNGGAGSGGASGDSGGSGGGGAYVPPAYARCPAPIYPPEAHRERHSGTVLLKVSVADSGQVASVSVRRGSGSAALDAAAVRTVERWLFQPARLNGRPVAAVVEIPVRFRLTG